MGDQSVHDRYARPSLVFMDTETTGLRLTDDVWEFAAIKRYGDGFEESWRFLVEHNHNKCLALPEPFLTDHEQRYHAKPDAEPVSPIYLAEFLENLTEDRPHIVGAVPNFDTERLIRLCDLSGRKWGGHYHLIDVENLAVGYLAGRSAHEGYEPLALPWDSDDLSRRCGVEPPTTERHTAMGDVLWCRALYDAITGGQRDA